MGLQAFTKRALAYGLIVLAIGGGVGPVTVASPAVATPAIRDIDWRASPLDLDLRGMNGERFGFHCPPGAPKPGQVVGSGLYADNSGICATAVHAGLMHAAAGGVITIEIRPGRSGYRGSQSHHVISDDYAGAWGGSFVLVPPPASRRERT